MTQVLSKLLSAAKSEQKFNRIAIVSSSAALVYWSYLLLSRSNIKRGNKNGDQEILFAESKSRPNSTRGKRGTRVDFGKTLRQLVVILKTIMSFKDLALTCGVTLGLVLRTLLDLRNIQITTKVESAIITANFDQLKYTLMSFAITMPTLAFVNNIIKYFTDQLSLRIRYNLSKQLYEKYMTNMTFYYLTQLKSSSGDGDQEFENIDQLLTSDVDKFSSSIVEVYNNLSKPILDIILLVHRMSSGYTGLQTPAIMIAWLAFVGSVLTQARRPLSSHIIRETQSEGQLRYVHSRLIQNSEEIAFFKGDQKEKATLMSSLNNLRDNLENLILFKFKIGMMDNIIGRYMSTIVGYLALAAPFFTLEYSKKSSEDRLTQYYISGRMMVKLAESITRVILAGQDLTKLAAYTERVRSLSNSMDSNQAQRMKKLNYKSSCSAENFSELDNCSAKLDDGRPLVEICDSENPMIDFKNVTLCTPNGDILVKNLTFQIKPKQSVLITGPNGSGKSSLFRVLGDLWPIESGRIIKPSSDKLFYICQKPYMTLGSLRSQLIFPDAKSKLSDQQLVEILKIVELNYLLERGGGGGSGQAADVEQHHQQHLSLDSINDWQDLLSGGEKQRMALARLIYHRPQFAILDECTSAVAIDVEQRIYKYLSEELECTLLSVSHRVKQLAKFHHLVLEFDGSGSFEFKRLVAPL